jgi:hypothetical protein
MLVWSEAGNAEGEEGKLLQLLQAYTRNSAHAGIPAKRILLKFDRGANARIL